LKRPLSEYKANIPHIFAARRMIELDMPVSVGTLIEYYIAETNTKSKLVRDKVKLLSEEGKYDLTYYLEKQILPAVENIFQVFDINIKEVIDGKKQDKLNKWF
jgi:DNA polymerase elongation subunit (family B)